MYNIHGKIDLGHRFEHCEKDKVKNKAIRKKKLAILWLTFFYRSLYMAQSAVSALAGQ